MSMESTGRGTFSLAFALYLFFKMNRSLFFLKKFVTFFSTKLGLIDTHVQRTKLCMVRRMRSIRSCITVWLHVRVDIASSERKSIVFLKSLISERRGKLEEKDERTARDIGWCATHNHAFGVRR